LSEADQRARRFLEPINSTLLKVSGATKKRMPDDDARLKIIKQGLVTIGGHINAQVPQHGQDLVDKLWDYVSEYHWPQAKAADKRVPGHKLRDMYKKISGKDNAAKASPTKPKPPPTEAGPSNSTNGAASPVPVKEPTKTEIVKSESSPDGTAKPARSESQESEERRETKVESSVEADSHEAQPNAPLGDRSSSELKEEADNDDDKGAPPSEMAED
jgi:chromodomain-helicase-DNA-binding protein 1